MATAAMYRRMLGNSAEEGGEMFNEDFFSENPFSSLLADFMIATQSPSGDLIKYSSYGVVNRNGEDQIVLIDFGLTKDVYATYYS